jgi:tetratricopeptide (TPR) repeat protein
MLVVARVKALVLILLLALAFSLSNANTVSAYDLLSDGIGLFNEDKLDEAQELFENFVESNSENPEVHYYLGRVYFNRDDLKKAEKHLKKAVELEETNSLYHTWLGNLYGTKVNRASIFKKGGIAKNIRKHFERALELDPDNLDAREGLIQFYNEAPGIAGGDRKKAKQHARILKEKDSFLGRRAFWQIFEKEKKWDLAEAEYKAAIEEFPERIGIKYRLGYFYQGRKKLSEAFEVFEQILADSSGNMGALYQLGRTGALSKQNLDRSAACLEEYLRNEVPDNNPSHASAHWRLGMVYHHKKDKALAREHYQKALELEPDHEQAKKALKKVK